MFGALAWLDTDESHRSIARHAMNRLPGLRAAGVAAFLFCAAPAMPHAMAQPAASAGSAPIAATAETLSADTPRTTVAGNTFVAPAGWSLGVRGPATVLEVPEGGSVVAVIDVTAADADAAVAAAWAAYRTGANWPLKVTTPVADRDGWTDRKSYSYQTSPNEKRDVELDVRRANGVWTVVIYDMAQDVGEKRAAQVNAIFGKLLPKGYQRESFAGRKAHPLDRARIAALGGFVERAMKLTGVPGVSFGLVQNGKVVYAGGIGVRELGRPARVDADTRFMIASNTKALATLMLAKQVDAGKIGWETPAVQLLPSFKLGDAATTQQVLVKHLICACTGMPRQDLEWLFEYGALTPEGAMTLLGTMQPTSGFGDLFQYSNPMAAAAGYLGGHVAYPTLPIGAAYDRAMQALVFKPLGMTRTTHDFAAAQRGNAAVPHAPDADGRPALAIGRVNLSIVPVRPAGGAWSSVNDMLKYVSMELAEGRLADGTRYIGKEALLARRAPQVRVSTDVTYGMGLMVDTIYGTPIVRHGGDMIGFHSDMMWLPEHDVGAVILTNGDPGWQIRSVFRRRLLEVLFDGLPEADATIAAQARSYAESNAAERKLVTIPADPKLAGDLAAHYANAAVGEVKVARAGAALRFDFGEWASDVGSRINPDKTVSFMTLVPGFTWSEFVVGKNSTGRRTLIMRDAQ
ncbi:MAG: serine hydrolase domain-containing protein, partial [Solirubrobacteraceae bacterium]|nr:serine hydrolase domain-containing protein [Solirubrobacteraceae bacterium]